MQLAYTQRWNERRAYYRSLAARGETFAPRCYEVAEIKDDTTPKEFIERHHYSGSYPNAIERFGLYHAGALCGVFVGSWPTNDKTLSNVFPEGDAIECGRFVLLPEVPTNGETWFQARCRELLQRRGYAGLLAFSDDVARTDEAGRQIFAGHLGTIYKASNALFLGRGTARTLRLLPDGRVFNERAISKIRASERGWRGAASILTALGAPEPPEDEVMRRAWLQEQLAKRTRKLPHPGNLKYVWRLHPRARVIGKPQPYPTIKISEQQIKLFAA